MLVLRPYQVEAIEAVYRHLREKENNPCLVIPTAGGKTPIMATICQDAVRRWNGRVLILAHVKELLQQSVDSIMAIAPDLPVGIYSAGLKRRDTDYAVTLAGIQSVYKHADKLGPFDLVFVDEAHLIPPDGEGMYRTFMADAEKINPNVRTIGMTATPFRMKSGEICGPDNILNEICYEIGVRELMVQGFLCSMKSKGGKEEPDIESVHTRGGEYIQNELEDLMDADLLVKSACREIVDYTVDRKACLIFTTGLRHGDHVAETIKSMGCNVETIYGNTPSDDRARIFKDFKAGRLKYLVTVNVATTGFDASIIDCVALLRPTLSPGLYYQMVGRGFRLCDGKANCLVLDFGGNVMRHGPVDDLKIEKRSELGKSTTCPAKKCPQCASLIHAGYLVCPDCGFQFPQPKEEEKHDAHATEADVVSSGSKIESRVEDVYYNVHTKRDAPEDAPKTMRVEYCIGYNAYVSEWVCFEHSGYAGDKAARWWRQRSDEPVPSTSAEAVLVADRGELKTPTSIVVKREEGSRFSQIVRYDFDQKTGSEQEPKPEPESPSSWNDPCPTCGRRTRTMIEDSPKFKEICAWCSHYFRLVSGYEYKQWLHEEIPF